MSMFVELYLLWKLPLRKYGLVPDHSSLQEISSCQIASLPDNLFPKVEEGFILFWKSSNFSFYSRGIVLDDGTEIEVDLVVLGTGYDGEKKLKSILPTRFVDVLQESADPLPLYRSVIHYNPELFLTFFPLLIQALQLSVKKFIDHADEAQTLKA